MNPAQRTEDTEDQDPSTEDGGQRMESKLWMIKLALKLNFWSVQRSVFFAVCLKTFLLLLDSVLFMSIGAEVQ